MGLKRNLVLAVFACILGLWVTGDRVLAAGDNAADNAQAGNVQGPGRGQIRDRIRAAMANNGITPEQRRRIRALVDEIRAKLQGLRVQAQQGNRAGIPGQLRSILQDLRQQIATILTPQQQAKLQELWQQRRQGAAGAQ